MKQKVKREIKTKGIDKKIKELEEQTQALKKLLDNIGNQKKVKPTIKH